MGQTGRNLISISELNDEDLAWLAARGAELSLGAPAGRPLDGALVGIHFRGTSTRTRTAFSAGALRLGAAIVPLGSDDLQTRTGETIEDTGRVLSGMLDALVVRTAAASCELRALGAHPGMAVVNAMTADEHPTQALADLATISARLGTISGCRILYVGEGNSTAAALAIALSRFRGTDLELRTPPGYGLAPGILAEAERQARAHAARVTERHDMARLPCDADIIYATRWQTTGTSKADPGWRQAFAPFRVSADLWRTSPKALFMHDLPAHRGEEVCAEVLDGPDSIAFTQAWNKMYGAMAVLEWCLGGGEA